MLLVACSGEDGDAGNTTTTTTETSTTIDPNLNSDGDCMTDVQEIELGTNPEAADSDGDGIGDCEEIACVSDPLDGLEKCYACGWQHNDPGTIVSTGATQGSVMAEVKLVDQCGEEFSLYDMFGSYFILWMTAAW